MIKCGTLYRHVEFNSIVRLCICTSTNIWVWCFVPNPHYALINYLDSQADYDSRRWEVIYYV